MKKIFLRLTLILFALFMFLSNGVITKAATNDLNIGINVINNNNLKVNDEVTVDINISLPQDNPNFVPGVAALGLELIYDSSVLEFVKGQPGTAEGLLSSDFESATNLKSQNKVVISYATPYEGIVKDGLFYSVKFKVISTTNIDKTNINVALRSNPAGTAVDYNLNYINTTFTSPKGIDILFAKDVNDADKDGVPDLLDNDDDNDGYSDAIEINEKTNPLDPLSIPTDTDGDGIVNSLDKDDDNDGYSDAIENYAKTNPLDLYSMPNDTDGDKIIDSLDNDDDNDGYSDAVERRENSDSLDPYSMPKDTDGDKLPDSIDTDDDNDGYMDAIERREKSDPLNPYSIPKDTDGDKLPDSIDTDDDNDGFSDFDEAYRGTNPLDKNSKPTNSRNIFETNTNTRDDNFQINVKPVSDNKPVFETYTILDESYYFRIFSLLR